MTNFGYEFNRKTLKEKDFFLEVDFTESLHSAMSKIPHLRNNDFESDAESDSNVSSLTKNNNNNNSKRHFLKRKNNGEQFSKDSSSSIEWEPFVELGAITKLLVTLKPEFLKFTESTETSIDQVILKLKCLLDYWTVDDKKMKTILANDNSLIKCEHCGVISLNKKRRNRAIVRPLEKGSRNFITSRSPTERFKSNSYLKFHEERVKNVQKDEKKINYHNTIVDDKYRKLPKNESNLKQITNFSHTFNSERQINSPAVNNHESNDEKEKLNCRNKYLDRPVIQVDIIPTSKSLENNSKSKMRLAQFILNRKLNQKQLETVTNKTISEDYDEGTNNQKLMGAKRNLKNDFKSSEKKLESCDDEKNVEKHLAKGDNSFFTKNVSSHIPKVVGLYHHHLDSPGDNLKSKFPHSIPNYDNQSMNRDGEKEEEEIIDANDFNYEKKLPLQIEEEIISKKYLNDEKKLSQVEEEDEVAEEKKEEVEEESTDSNFSSEENSDEWLNTTFDSRQTSPKKISQLKKSLQIKKSLQKLKFIQEMKSSLKDKKSLTEKISKKVQKKSSEEKLFSQERISSEDKLFLQGKKSFEEKRSSREKLNSPEKNTSQAEISSQGKRILQNVNSSQEMNSWKKSCQSIGMQTANTSLTSVSSVKIQTEAIKSPDKKFINERTFLHHENEEKNTFNSHKNAGNLKKKNSEKIISETLFNDEMNKETTKISSLYEKILNGEEGMDWETFQQLVETLHPTQRELWKDVCTFVKNEAKQISGSEVFIEVKSISKKSRNNEINNNNESRIKNADEISIEMDMKLKDVEEFFENKLKSCLMNRKLKTIKMREK